MRTRAAVTALLVGLLGGCAHEHSHPDAASEKETWALTAWGESYELFPEVDALVAGEVATSHTHVTRLSDFQPLRAGRVAAVLRDGSGRESVFAADAPIRDGIFNLDIRPPRAGDFDLSFRIEEEGRSEEVAGGRVRVGAAGRPGGLIDAPPSAPPPVAGEEIPFLKEQQWRTPFRTGWTREGALPDGLSGPGRLRPVAGGERALTAPVDAVLQAAPWPWQGMTVGRGDTVFRLVGAVPGARSLAELEAAAQSLAAERDAAAARLRRLEELLELEAVARASVEEQHTLHTSLSARAYAAERDLESARAARSGGASGAGLALRAPWSGVVAAVNVSPGQAVSAGEILGRLVRPSPLWIEIALAPEDAVRVGGAPSGLWLRHGTRPPRFLDGDRIRLVSRSPELDPRTARVAVIVEADVSASELPIGSAVEAELLLEGEREGVVIPEAALVDDAGVPVVYLQTGGESFVRQPVQVLARQGDRLLVADLEPGLRLVTRGGADIRRASLLSGGPPEGHVH